MMSEALGGTDLFGPEGCLSFCEDQPPLPEPEVGDEDLPALFRSDGCLTLQEGVVFEVPAREARDRFSGFRREHPGVYKTIAALAVERERVDRLTTQNGAAGEAMVIEERENWIPRPKGEELKVLLSVMEEAGTPIKKSAFDAIALPEGCGPVDLRNPVALRRLLPEMTFVEIKTSKQERVKEDFSGFLFSFTHGELLAAQVLKGRHCVALINKLTGKVLITTVQEILARATSKTHSMTVQI